MTSVTVEHTSCIAGVPAAGVARVARHRPVLVGMQGGRELADGRGVGRLERVCCPQPCRVRRGGDRAHIEEHEGVVEPAQLGALAPVDAVVEHVEVEAGPVAGAGVAAEVELGDVEAVQHVVGAEVDARRLSGRHDHGGGVGGLADDLDPVGVLELPTPLEGVHVDHRGRVRLHRRDRVLHHHRGPEQPEHNEDGNDGVGDLGERVVLRLHRHLVGAAAIAEDGPQDEQEGEAADDEPGDEEALPEVEGGAALGGRALVGAEARELAAGEEHGAQGDQYGGEPAAWTLGTASWGFGCVERGAGQRRVHRADTIEPCKKIGNRSRAVRAPAASVRVGVLGYHRLVGGPGEHAPRHGGGGPGGPGGEDLPGAPAECPRRRARPARRARRGGRRGAARARLPPARARRWRWPGAPGRGRPARRGRQPARPAPPPAPARGRA